MFCWYCVRTNINIAFTVPNCVPNVLFLPSADPRLMGALRRTGCVCVCVCVCVVEMKEWMQRICVSIHLESRSVLFQIEQEMVRYSRYIIWLIFT